MADSVYDISVRVGLESAGLVGGVGLVMNAFKGLESESAKAEGVVAKLASSMGVSSSVFTQSANRMGTYQTQIGAVTAAHTKLNQAMQGTALLAGGAVLTGVGLGLFGALKGAADQAAQLVPLMTQIRIATLTPLGASGNGTMQMLQQLAVQQGTRTQFSLQEEAGIMAAMTKAGIAGPGSVNRIQQMLPMISNFAEVMKMTRGDSATESATTATELAHLYGQYDAKVGKTGPGVNYMVDLAGKALSVTPGTQKTFLTTLSQMSGQMRPLYGSNRQGFISDSIALTMLEGQLGQQGRGGTQIASMLGRTLGAGSTAFGSRTSTQNKDMKDLTALANKGGGTLSFFNSKGQFSGISEFLSILEKAAANENNPEKLGQLFRGAFGAVGLRQAGILADPITVAQFGKIGQYLGPNGVVDTAKQRDAYNASPTGQAAKLSSDWSTVSTLFGQAYIPVMATALGVLAGALGSVANFMSDHPGMTQLVSWAAAAAVGLTTLSGVILMVRGATMLWGAASEVLGLAKLAEGIGFVTTALRTQGIAAVVSTVATRAWAVAQAAGSAIAAVATAAYGLLDGVVIALSGGFSIATIASSAFGAVQGVVAVATNSLSVSLIAATVWNRALAAAQAASAAVSGVAAVAYGLLDAAVITMSGGFGIATIAAAALDLALSPITITVAALAVGAGAAYYAWTNWATVAGALSGKLGPVWQGVATLVTALDPAIGLIAVISGAFHTWDTIMAKVSGTIRLVATDMRHLAQAVPSLPALPGLPRLPAAGRTGLGAIEQGFVHGVISALPGGNVLAPIAGAFGIGGGGGGVMPGHGGGAGGGVTHHHGPVTIHIHPLAHHSATDIAHAVKDILYTEAGTDSRRQGSSNIGWDLGYNGF